MQTLPIPGDGDAQIARECESELRTIAEALEHAHLLIGIAGLILGACAGCLLLLTGVDPFGASPALAVVLSGALGAALGLLFGARGPARVAPATRHGYHQYQ